MPDEFKVTGITVSEVPVIPALGPITRHTIVRYMVGQHGPFQDDYTTAEYTPEKAKTGIEARVRDQRTLVQAFPEA